MVSEAYTMEQVSIENAFNRKYHETQFTLAETDKFIFSM